jgi:hypothetical protein
MTSLLTNISPARNSIEPEDIKEYPYSSQYLQCLYHEHKLDGHQLYIFVNEIQDWLEEYVKRDGKNNYQWIKSDSFLIVWYDINKSWRLAKMIRFRFQDDLLAFKLKFRISL